MCCEGSARLCLCLTQASTSWGQIVVRREARTIFRRTRCREHGRRPAAKSAAWRAYNRTVSTSACLCRNSDLWHSLVQRCNAIKAQTRTGYVACVALAHLAGTARKLARG